MDRREVIALIKRNRFSKTKAIKLISDFLVISYDAAKLIYEREVVPEKTPSHLKQYGTRSPVLTTKDEQEIRRKFRDGTTKTRLTKEYNISYPRLEDILRSEAI